MRFNEAVQSLQNLTNKEIKNKDLASALKLKSRSAVNYRKENNVFLNDDEEKMLEEYFNVSFTNNDKNNFKLKPEPNNKTLDLKKAGRVIQKIRAENGLTISRFCKVIELEPQEEDIIIDWANGDKDPSYDFALKVAVKVINHFNITMDEFFSL